MKKNDIVKFKNETNEEKDARESGIVIMRVLWVHPPRVAIVVDIGHMTNPVSVHSLDDVELVNA